MKTLREMRDTVVPTEAPHNTSTHPHTYTHHTRMRKSSVAVHVDVLVSLRWLPGHVGWLHLELHTHSVQMWPHGFGGCHSAAAGDGAKNCQLALEQRLLVVGKQRLITKRLLVVGKQRLITKRRFLSHVARFVRVAGRRSV